MPNEIKAYTCSYCGGNLSSNLNLILEHEKMCACNPNRILCFCSLCVHGEKHSYDTTDRWGRQISKGYHACKLGREVSSKFNDTYNYCARFIDKRGEN